MSEQDTPDTRRCRRCSIPHFKHPDANKNGGVGQLIPWEGDLCPICTDRRGELANLATWRYLAELLSGDGYVRPTEDEQATLGEVA